MRVKLEPRELLALQETPEQQVQVLLEQLVRRAPQALRQMLLVLREQQEALALLALVLLAALALLA